MRALLSVAFLVVCSGTMHADWSIEVIESLGITGYWTAIRTGSDGYLHIVYRNDTENALMHAWQQGEEWTFEVVDYCECWFMAMVLDNEDNPRITYWEKDQDRICHVQWDGSGWQTDILGSAYQSEYHYPSSDIEIDSTGRSHVVWYDGSDLNHAVQDPSGVWSISTVDSTGNTGRHPSLILDEQDNPHISYGNVDSGHLYYSSKQGGSWQTEIADPCQCSRSTSIALDSFGAPHIMYFGIQDVNDSSVGTVSYATPGASGWETEIVAIGIHYHPASPQGISLDADNNPHISTLLVDIGAAFLTYRYKDATGWHSEYVDGPNAGFYNAICFDSEGQPNISYSSGSNDDLCWAHRSNVGVWSGDEVHVTEQRHLTITPVSNPISGTVSMNIQMVEAGSVTIRVFNTAGRLVDELSGIELSQGSHSLSIGEFSTGLYFCEAESGSSTFETSFIVLE